MTDDERERLAAMCREAIDWRERWCAADTNGLVASARRQAKKRGEVCGYDQPPMVEVRADVLLALLTRDAQ